MELCDDLGIFSDEKGTSLMITSLLVIIMRGGIRVETPQVEALAQTLSCVTLGYWSLGEVVVGSLDMLRRIGIGSLLILFCNIRSYVVDLSCSYLYLHDLCSAVSNIKFMISLLCYYMLCLVRELET